MLPTITVFDSPRARAAELGHHFERRSVLENRYILTILQRVAS